MMPRFSLKQLLIVVAFSCVACASLARPGVWWHGTVVTAVAVAAIGMLIAAIVGSPQQRAFSIGWIVLSVGYLACVLGPWTAQHVGPQLLSSKGLLRLEYAWHKDQPSPPVFGYSMMDADGDGVIDLWIDGGRPGYGRPVSRGVVAWNLKTLGAVSAQRPQAAPASNHSFFQATGHWLLAIVLGHLGGLFAAAMMRHGSRSAA